MFASSTRRIEDRDGGVGAASAVNARSSKSLTPTSSSDKIPTLNASRKSSVEKENRRSTSRGASIPSTQKPTIRQIPRVDKTSLVSARNGGEVRERRSTSSVPRGRSSSPFEFRREFSDTRKDRRVSVDRVVKGSVTETDRSLSSRGRGIKIANHVKGNRDMNIKGSAQVAGRAKFQGETDENQSKGLNSGFKSGNSGGLRKKVGESEYNDSFVKSQSCDEKVDSACKLRVQTNIGIAGQEERCSSVAIEKKGNGTDSNFKEQGGKSAGDAKILEIPKEKGSGDASGSSGVTIKPSSRLHEKLAFLEGKVKRIASDIRRTKEMLDMNNPDASKMILSDIQDKISGIEKAIDHVASDSEDKLGFLKSDAKDDKESDVVIDSQTTQACKGKCVVKELNSEELEARLFPHRKLLQSRTTSKTSSFLNNECSVKEHRIEPTVVVEEKEPNPVEESSIALEFLANLNIETRKVTSRGEQADKEYCEVQETGVGASGRSKDTSSTFNQKSDIDLLLTTDEKFEEFDDQENRQGAYVGEETEDDFMNSLNDIGNKTSVGGWFVSEGEAVLLTHDDGSCSYYDIANCEVCKLLRITSLCRTKHTP